MIPIWVMIGFIFFSAFAVGLWCDERWPKLRPKNGWIVGIAVIVSVWGLGWLPYLGHALAGKFGAVMFIWLQLVFMAWAIVWMMRWMISLLQGRMGGPSGGTRA